MNRHSRKLQAFARFAVDLSKLSTCKRRKVGCVICAPDFTSVLSIGYNGPASGESNDACVAEEGACGCLHAECNALLKLRGHETGLLLITTTSPCMACAGMIINSRRVSRIMYLSEYRDLSGLARMECCGVPVERLTLDPVKRAYRH